LITVKKNEAENVNDIEEIWKIIDNLKESPAYLVLCVQLFTVFRSQKKNKFFKNHGFFYHLLFETSYKMSSGGNTQMNILSCCS
jgi:hypothetical protein